MTDKEARELIGSVSTSLGINRLMTQDYAKEIIRESDGNPYVIKILLGEVAKAKRLVALRPIVASQDEILDALFERTFAGLSPASKRIMFLLSSWRSTVPELAIHAVLARRGGSGANRLRLDKLGNQQAQGLDYAKEIIRESDGNPYVIKILLGEVAKEIGGG